MVPYACLDCHHVFSRPESKTHFIKPCPHCGQSAYQMDVRFKAPKSSDSKQWQKVSYLVHHGFFFQKIYKKTGDMWERKPYPLTMAEAKQFVQLYADQAIQIDGTTGEIIQKN